MPSKVATLAILILLLACSTSPVITPSAAPSQTPTLSGFMTPTIEYCEALQISWQAQINLNVRADIGTHNEIVGQLAIGDTFEGNLCSEPDDDNVYQWTQVIDESKSFNGGWVARYALPYDGTEWLQ